MPITPRRPHPTGEDYLRALAYAALMAWSVVFVLHPPTAFQDSLAAFTLHFWHGVAFTGSLMALLGSITRIDLKLELPGLIILLIGPALYCVSQIFLVVVPGLADVQGRYALIIYSIIPALLVLPRMYALNKEVQQAKRSAITRANSIVKAAPAKDLLFTQDLKGRKKP